MMQSFRATVGATAALVLLFALHFSGVKPTNISGYEWPIVHLAAQGVLSEPHANRPLGLLWHLPPALVGPHSFAGYLSAHALYTVLAAALFYWLCLRLAPDRPWFAWLATALSLTWAPLDHARLDAIPAITYSGATLGALAAIGLFVESWLRQRVFLLAGAVAVALLVSRVSEATLPLFVGAPILLWCRAPADVRRRPTWLVVWSVAVLVGLGLAAGPLFAGQASYQAGMGFDPHPLHVLRRLLLQFRFHLAPLVGAPPHELASSRVAVSAAAFLVSWIVLRRGGGDREPAEARSWLRPLGLGLYFAALAYGGFVLAAAYVTPERMQILSAPGIGLFLAATLCLLADRWPWGGRHLVAGALGTWIVALGTAHTMALQRDWDSATAFPRQSLLLTGMFERAPDVKPHTLFVLLDNSATFPAAFAFRHAVSYLYPGRAVGLTPGGPDPFYPSTFTPTGVRIEPLAILRGPWSEPVSVHRYDEIVVLVQKGGRPYLLDAWPNGALPALPPGALYDPHSRIVPETPQVPARAIVTR